MILIVLDDCREKHANNQQSNQVNNQEDNQQGVKIRFGIAFLSVLLSQFGKKCTFAAACSLT